MDFGGGGLCGELFGGGFGVAGVSGGDGAGDFGGHKCAGELERDEWGGLEGGDV